MTIRSAFQAWLMQWMRKSSPSALRQSVSVRHGRALLSGLLDRTIDIESAELEV